MPDAKEIKGRIKSVSETQKITNAMYLIASTKLQRAKKELDASRPYFDTLRNEVRRILWSIDEVKSRYLFKDEREIDRDKVGCLVITADKGLAGAYNINVLKEADRILAEHKDVKLFVVGEYGRQHYQQRKVPIDKSFLYTAQNPTLARARDISEYILELFDNEELDEIFLIYTDMKNGMNVETKLTRLLPFHESHFAGGNGDNDADYEFYPNAHTILDILITNYMTGFIHSALVDSFCCEQNARMTAMDSANRNSQKILDTLSLQYNQVRQAAITREITEVSAGAKAQRKKRERRKQAAAKV